MRKVIPVDPAFFAEIPAVEAVEERDAEVVLMRDLRLRRHVRALPPVERKVIDLYFGLNTEAVSTCEIAKQLGTSRQYVSKVKQRALIRLRERYADVTFEQALDGQAPKAA